MIDLLSFARIRPAVLQIEIHPYFPQTHFIKWLQEQKIVVTAYSSFGSISYLDVFSDFSKSVDSLLELDTVKSIASTHNKSTGQILLRWAVQQNCIVIPKSTNEQRIKDNINLFDFNLSDSEMEELSK